MSGSRGVASGVALPPREAIEYLRGKTNVTSQHWTDVWRDAHVRSFMVAGAATDAIVGDFRRAVADALEQGTTLRDFRRRFDEIVSRHGWVHNGTAAWRSRIIYETNLSTAYAAGRYAQQTEPDTLAVYPYWQYVHSGAAHPRLQHQAWNGLVLRADDPFWRTHYPPNGWRCGCRVRVLSARALARQGRSGPDPSPAIETRPWTNPRTGEVHQVPTGIDPGFDYNPGMAWRGPPQVPGDAVTRPPPEDWPPPTPGRGPLVQFPSAERAPALRPPAPRPEDELTTIRVPDPEPQPMEPRVVPAAVPDDGSLADFRLHPRRTSSRFAPELREADRILTDAYRPWFEALSVAERDALALYKGHVGPAMNRHLRGIAVPSEIADAVPDLAAGLRRALMPRAVTVFATPAIAAASSSQSSAVRFATSVTVTLPTAGTVKPPRQKAATCVMPNRPGPVAAPVARLAGACSFRAARNTVQRERPRNRRALFCAGAMPSQHRPTKGVRRSRRSHPLRVMRAGTSARAKWDAGKNCSSRAHSAAWPPCRAGSCSP